MSEPTSIAWSGEVEFSGAFWSDRDGRTVELRLIDQDPGLAHPFKAHQRRRGGRVGTIFESTLVEISGAPAFTGQLMLAGWTDSSSRGQRVKFWLDAEPGDHPFAGMSRPEAGRPGTRMMMVLVEVGDDGEIVDAVQREKVETLTGGPISRNAGMHCADPDFRSWIMEAHPLHPADVPEREDQYAAEAVRQFCHISSRALLDHDERAAARYEKLKREFLRASQPAEGSSPRGPSLP